MRDIYLIDFENVASEGLSGITALTEDDQVILFYSNNSNRLSMKMHILIGKSVCKLDYFEASVGGKNALDHQISTYLGYLVGTKAAQRAYYIVSRDTGYKFVASFWNTGEVPVSVRCIDAVRTAARLERKIQEQRARSESQGEPISDADVQEQSDALSAEPEESAEAPVDLLGTDELDQGAVAVRSSGAALMPSALAEAATEEPEESAPELSDWQTVEEILSSLEPGETQEVQRQPHKTARRQSRGHGGRRTRSGARQNQTDSVTKSASRSEDQPEPIPESAQHPQPVLSSESRGDQKPAQEKPKQRRGRPKKQTAQPEAKKPAVVSRAPVVKQPEPDHAPGRQLEQISTLLSAYPALQADYLKDLVNQKKKQVLCNTLRKQLGQEKGLALYNEIKKTAWR